MNDIFISYSRYDTDVVNEIVALLELEGYSIWIDRDGIESGEDFKRVILKAIKESKVILFFSSEHSNVSDWTAKEIGVAVKYKKHIIPIKLDDSNFNEAVEFDLINLDYIDYSKASIRKAMWGKLLKTLRNKIGNGSKELERLEAERKAKEEAERARIERERLERIEAERKAEEAKRKAEQERLERERAEAQRREKQEKADTIMDPDYSQPKSKKVLWIALGAMTLVASVLLLACPKRDNNNQNDVGQKEDMVEPMSDLTISVHNVSFVMKPVEGGTFQMGSNDNEANEDEHPVHSVTVSSFYMGETEVTQALWQAVMGDGPKELNWSDKFGKGNLFPVYGVNLSEIIDDFLPKLNDLTGREFRLPTEAEWEFAARGGNNSNGYKYAGSNSINDVAWYVDNSAQMFHEVKSKKPNELGLYDMSGNVCEHCTDWYVPDYYSVSPSINPQGPSWGHYPVNRGGCVLHRKEFCRVSLRDNHDGRLIKLGFRLVLSK